MKPPVEPSLYASLAVPSTWSFVNAGFSVILTLLILTVLIRWAHEFILVERIGFGVAGSAAFLSMFKQLGFAKLMLPFNDLYQFGWRLGWLLVVGGLLVRLRRHHRRNVAAMREARLYFDSKGAVR